MLSLPNMPPSPAARATSTTTHTKETIQKLEQMDVEYYRTDLSGNITFTSDGSSISVRTEKP